MKHDDRTTTPTLNPEEAVRLGRLRTISDLRIVEKLYEAYDKVHHEIKFTSPIWYTQCLLATCWNAGRIEGIRMERERRKQTASKKRRE